MTLDELIQEAERLDRASSDAAAERRWMEADRFATLQVRLVEEEADMLLAVAKAAVEIAPQIEGFCREAETGVRPPGGQQAGMDRSWASRVPPSVIGELRWYSRAFREFLAAFDRAAGEGEPIVKAEEEDDTVCYHCGASHWCSECQR